MPYRMEFHNKSNDILDTIEWFKSKATKTNGYCLYTLFKKNMLKDFMMIQLYKFLIKYF